METPLETHVWLSTKRYSPFQQPLEGTLSFDGHALTFLGDEGQVLETTLSEARLTFPRSMLGQGFELKVRETKLYLWFADPFAGRQAILESGDQDDANVATAKGFFEGRKNAKPWLRALRAATG